MSPRGSGGGARSERVRRPRRRRGTRTTAEREKSEDPIR